MSDPVTPADPFEPAEFALPEPGETETARPAKGRSVLAGMRRGFAVLALGAVGLALGAALVNINNVRTPVLELTSWTEEETLTDLVAFPLSAGEIVSFDQREPETAIGVERVMGKLRRNSTLIDTIGDMGVDRGEAARALETLYQGDWLNPRKLRAGLEVQVTKASDGELIGLTLTPEAGRSLIAKRQANGSYFAAELPARLIPSLHRVSTTIETSLYEAALKEGAGDQQVVDFAQIFAFDVDFQREIHPGDTFELVYETLADERGNRVRTGDLVYASLNGRVIKKSYYRHVPSDDGVADYFNPDGESATRFLMKTPINGARLSSSFGRRRHPISGYTRLHKGTDFAARTGTPIFAAGNGVVERASRYGGYGKYVRIQHANGYETAYAHMSRYGPGVRKGKRVRQGDIIGYVGSTGASTGPHLHYEVIINGKHVNAMRLKLPTGRKLQGDLKEEFFQVRDSIDAQRRDLGADLDVTLVASAQRAN